MKTLKGECLSEQVLSVQTTIYQYILFFFYSISKACNHYVEARHAIFLATILGDAATIATTSVIIGIDFLLNIYHGLKIVYLIKKKKASPSDDNSKFRITYCS